MIFKRIKTFSWALKNQRGFWALCGVEGLAPPAHVEATLHCSSIFPLTGPRFLAVAKMEQNKLSPKLSAPPPHSTKGTCSQSAGLHGGNNNKTSTHTSQEATNSWFKKKKKFLNQNSKTPYVMSHNPTTWYITNWWWQWWQIVLKIKNLAFPIAQKLWTEYPFSWKEHWLHGHKTGGKF